MTDAWDALTPAQREKVEWKVNDQISTFRVTAVSDIARFAVNAYADVTNYVPGRFTSKVFLEDQRVRAYDSGWDDGHQAGKDEALDAIEQLAKAKADA